jgi:Ca-activated chloride channel family protein
VGPSSSGDLGNLGWSLAREGIAVTTIGLGLDYNEDLMTRLAYKSDGNHFFVERAEDLAPAYATEFGDALSVVAQNVRINIHCHDGARPVRVLGRDADITGRAAHASMGQLYSDQTRFLVLEVDVPAGLAGQTRNLADVFITFNDLRLGRQSQQHADLLVSFTDSARIVTEKTDREVMASVVGLIGADPADRAMALRDAGKIEEARAAYIANADFLAEQAQKLDDEQLDKAAVSNIDASQNLAPQDWQRERKSQQLLQFKTRQQRASVPDDKGKAKTD